MSKKQYEQMPLFDGPFVCPLPEPTRGRKRKSGSSSAKKRTAQAKNAPAAALPAEEPILSSAEPMDRPAVLGTAVKTSLSPKPVETDFPAAETTATAADDPQEVAEESAADASFLDDNWSDSDIEAEAATAVENSSTVAPVLDEDWADSDIETAVEAESAPAAEETPAQASFSEEEGADSDTEVEAVTEMAPVEEKPYAKAHLLDEDGSDSDIEAAAETESAPVKGKPCAKEPVLDEDWADSDIEAAAETESGPAAEEAPVQASSSDEEVADSDIEAEAVTEAAPAVEEPAAEASSPEEESAASSEDAEAEDAPEKTASEETVLSSAVSETDELENAAKETSAEILDDTAPSSELPGPEPAGSSTDAEISSVPEQPWTVSNILEGYSAAQSQEERNAYVRRLEDMGDKGDAQACLILGLNYDPYRHKGFQARNEETSLRWYTKSADLGNARAANEAAILFYRGTPVVRNRELAIRYAETAVSLAPDSEVFAKNLSIIKSGPYRDRYTAGSKKNPDEILLQGKAKNLAPFNITYTSAVALIAAICAVTGAISLSLLAYPVAGLLLLQLLINYAISKCKVIIASGYITGQCSFHRDVCIPMKCIRAVGTSVFGGIKVSAANVNAVFYMLENDDEIYNTLCEMIIAANS